MLNEVYRLERGLSVSGFEVAPRHADVSSPGRTEAVHVRLDERGLPVEVAALERDRVASLWTLRNGKHNSFPFVQLKLPLLSIPESDAWRKAHGDAWKALVPGKRRQCLRDLAHDYPVSPKACALLLGRGLRESLKARQHALAALNEPSASVPALVDRFLGIKEPAQFGATLLAVLLAGLDEADDLYRETAHVLLVGRVAQGKLTGSPLLFDALRGEFARDIADPRHAASISKALSFGSAQESVRGLCLLEGTEAVLHAGNFPQPTVPVIGQIYLFSKNGDIPAAYRYGRADTTGLPISSELSQRLAGALHEITKPDLKGSTWRDVPGEKPKSRDLLIAFADGALGAPVAALIAADDIQEPEPDPFEETTDHLNEAERQAAVLGDAKSAFLARAERVVEAVKGKAGVHFRDTPVIVLVLRKVDTGNAKAILNRALNLGGLYDAAVLWAAALNNLPPWLKMPVPRKSGPAHEREPTAVSPLQIPRATRLLFIHGGMERAPREPMGVTAADALTLFLGETGAEPIARATLRIVLGRQGILLSGAAQALRRDRAQDGLKAALGFDRASALQSAMLTGLLLAKIGRKKETYMASAAFQLGQVLAATDVIHVGYCMDVRGGQVPPTLLGNSMLVIAHDDPRRALAMLCRRLGPYLAWVRRTDWDQAESSTKSKDAKERTKGWSIKAALSNASRIRVVAEALCSNLPDSSDTGDTFRAELLLGYVAGLPKVERETKAGIERERS